MDKAQKEQIIQDVTVKLDELNIDVYLILTSEGSDPITPFFPGVGTVSAGAFAFTRDGRRYALSTKIDARTLWRVACSNRSSSMTRLNWPFRN